MNAADLPIRWRFRGPLATHVLRSPRVDQGKWLADWKCHRENAARDRDVRQTAQGWRGEGPSEVVQCCGVTTNTLDHEALRLVGALGGTWARQLLVL